MKFVGANLMDVVEVETCGHLRPNSMPGCLAIHKQKHPTFRSYENFVNMLDDPWLETVWQEQCAGQKDLKAKFNSRCSVFSGDEHLPA